MAGTTMLKALMKKAGVEFAPGERVRVRREGKWKLAVVRAVIVEPAPSSDVYYELRCAGKDDRRHYRARELQRVA